MSPTGILPNPPNPMGQEAQEGGCRLSLRTVTARERGEQRPLMTGRRMTSVAKEASQALWLLSLSGK